MSLRTGRDVRDHVAGECGAVYCDLCDYEGTQLEMLQPHPAMNGTETSAEAAVAIAPHVNGQHQRILTALAQSAAVWSQGLTDEEIQTSTNLSPNSERPRRRELERMGLIVPRGHGVTASGRRAVTWGLG